MKMKAVVYAEYGPPEALRIEEVETPTPQDNEIRVRIAATTVNYGEVTARNFKNISYREFNMPAPLVLFARLAFGPRKPRNPILGSEFAGVVDAVGKDVTRFKVGDAVFGYRGAKMGAYAEHLCAPENSMTALKPDNLTFEQAAALTYGATTAWSLLQKVAIRPGQKVLINGASGSIGSQALQIAKHFGAEVTGVASASRLEYVKALGADHVIDYTQEDFTRNGETYDLIFDVLGRSSFAACQTSLTENGVYMLASFKMRALIDMLWTSLTGSSRKVICAMSSERLDVLLAVKDLIEAGAITSIVDRSFPMDQAAEAHRYFENGHAGSVVITMA